MVVAPVHFCWGWHICGFQASKRTDKYVSSRLCGFEQTLHECVWNMAHWLFSGLKSAQIPRLQWMTKTVYAQFCWGCSTCLCSLQTLYEFLLRMAHLMLSDPRCFPDPVLHITQNYACSCAEDAKLAAFSMLNQHQSVYTTSSLWCFTRFTQAVLLRIAGL